MDLMESFWWTELSQFAQDDDNDGDATDGDDDDDDDDDNDDDVNDGDMLVNLLERIV